MGKRLFLTLEPDELACIDRDDGRILWRRTNNYLDATPPEERTANPLFKQVEAIAARIRTAAGYAENLKLHGQMNAILQKIDPLKYDFRNGTGVANFVVGFATPNVTSDGKHVYAYFTHGVAACYDLDGNRRWIRLLTDLEPGIGNQSPALSGNAFIVQRQDVRAFDKATGNVLWTTRLNDNRCGSTVPARVGGTDVVIVNFEQVLRSSDGKLLSPKRPVHHTTPVVVEGNLVVGGYDGQLTRWRMDSVNGGLLKTTNLPGAEADTPADSLSSYLYHRGFVYMLDSKGILMVWRVNEHEAQAAYHKALGGGIMRPLYETGEYGCGASPMLGGNNVYLLDNQGTTVVVKPGGAYEPVAVNRIENYLPRQYITNTQERFTTSPICDGKYLYIRGERTLYCIGETATERELPCRPADGKTEQPAAEEPLPGKPAAETPWPAKTELAAVEKGDVKAEIKLQAPTLAAASEEEIRMAWSRFRGPAGSGIAPYANLPDRWDAASGENILWRADLPLRGNNSPVVCGRRVFLSAADKGHRQVFCFDAATGRVVVEKRAAQHAGKLAAGQGGGRRRLCLPHAGHQRPLRRRGVCQRRHCRLRLWRPPGLVEKPGCSTQ